MLATADRSRVLFGMRSDRARDAYEKDYREGDGASLDHDVQRAAHGGPPGAQGYLSTKVVDGR
jgi:hypothetical protein